MSYTVGADGRTGNLGAISPPDAPACLQAALRTWVADLPLRAVLAARLTAAKSSPPTGCW